MINKGLLLLLQTSAPVIVIVVIENTTVEESDGKEYQNNNSIKMGLNFYRRGIVRIAITVWEKYFGVVYDRSSTLSCMNVVARVLSWCTVVASLAGVIWYSYELKKTG